LMASAKVGKRLIADIRYSVELRGRRREH